jgi:hypothetical protein
MAELPVLSESDMNRSLIMFYTEVSIDLNTKFGG